MREPSNIRDVAQLLPDLLGFIFYPESPRYVGEDFVMPVISESIKKVGVFVNAKIETVMDTVERFGLHVVQLHGDESVDYVVRLHKSGTAVIKAFRVDENFDFENTVPYQPFVAFLLFDTKGRNYGGNNRVFDWQLLRSYNQRIPFLLSGGLNAENLRNLTALDGMNCAGFDLNSGVETVPGQKNVDEIKDAISVLNYYS